MPINISLRGILIGSGQYLLVDMAVVSPEARGSGLYKRLRRSIHVLGKRQGFKGVVGELSSAETQHVCIRRFGHSAFEEIPYDSFRYQDEFPFASIATPRSIVLTVGQL